MVGVVTLGNQLDVNTGRIAGESGSIPQQSGGVGLNGRGISDLSKDLHVLLGLQRVGTDGGNGISSGGTVLQNGHVSGCIRNTGVQGNTNIVLAGSDPSVQSIADGLSGNNDTVDLQLVVSTVVGHLEGVDLATLIVHGDLDVGSSLVSKATDLLVGGHGGQEALSGSGTLAGTTDQRQPVVTEVDVTGLNTCAIGDVEGDPVVSLAVLTAVGVLIDADLHVEAILQGLSFLSLRRELRGVVGVIGADGHETLVGVLVTGIGLNVVAFFEILVLLGVTPNVPVAFNVGGSSGECHYGNHGQNHHCSNDKSNQLFHVEKTPFSCFIAVFRNSVPIIP